MTPDPNSPTRTSPPAGPATPVRCEGVVFAGRYHVVRPLGEGGMGAVFLARDAELDRDVAVKVLPGERAGSPDSVARFRREATALAKLAHPNIVQAFDVGEHAGRPFLVMEYVPGENLADRLKAGGPLPPTRAADVGHQVALALAYAHSRGLVHRDVKPGNVILTPDGRAKLLDLGLVRFLQDQLGDPTRTREGTGMGTPDYSAPEQFRDARAADPRSDVYALGCTLYHLIAGRVPFPGSSLSEKLDAHEKHDPPPLEELVPDTPVGLALAVRRMMAKRPADRFQSAAAAADALAPYVAGGSSTVAIFRQTAVWDGSQIRGTPPRRSGPVVPTVLGLAAGLLLALVGVGVAGKVGWVRLGGPDGVAQGPPSGPHEPNTGGTAIGPELAPPPRLAAATGEDPNVLTVSQTEQGGGRFRTINAALAAAQPGQTVRVLDAAVYREQVVLSSPTRQAGVTVEAVRGATLAPVVAGPNAAVFVRAVPGVMVRGFRLRAESEGEYLVVVRGPAPGVCLDELEMGPGRTTPAVGVHLENLGDSESGPPVVVRGCRIERARIGVQVRGLGQDYHTPQPAARVVVRDNRIETPHGGINLQGDLRHVHVVGNVIVGATAGGIQFQNLSPGARDLLVANNTCFECSSPLRYWGDKSKGVPGANVRVRNNLVVAPVGRAAVFRHAVDADQSPGYGDGAEVTAKWDFARNWRESGGDEAGPGLIPPGKTDVAKPKIEGVNREPKSPNFLRPEADSELSTLGAGQEDPTLPAYVGALPPTGGRPWDWDRTWRMPKGAQLLTVSKVAEGGGAYRTIADALKAAKPWATVRVLDAAVYEEAIALDQPDRHTGVCLEAVAGATLALPKKAPAAVAITGVPHVRVRGFRFTGSRTMEVTASVRVRGPAAGVVLEGLDVRTAGESTGDSGVVLQDVLLAPDDEPLVVRRCRFDVVWDGVVLVSRPAGGPDARTSGVLIADNHVAAARRGILIAGAADRVQVTGNRVENCTQAGLQVQDLTPDSVRIVFANNTAWRCTSGFRAWHTHGQPVFVSGQVVVGNNLLGEAQNSDAVYILTSQIGPGAALLGLWRFRTNARDLSGLEPGQVLPLAETDFRLDRSSLLTTDPNSPDYLRPRKDSSLATRGAGAIDPLLPPYVGAVPPEGAEPWDWSRTWRWTMAGRARPGGTTAAEK